MFFTAFISIWFAFCPIDKKEFVIERTAPWQSSDAPEDQRNIEECPWCHVAIFSRLRKLTQVQDVAVPDGPPASPGDTVTMRVEKKYTVIWERNE